MSETGLITSFSTLLASAVHYDQSTSVVLPPDWLQGRSTFGGLTAALSIAAAQQVARIPSTFRSAQFAFTGPVSGTVELQVEVLRRGRSSAYVAVDVICDHRLSGRAMILFAEDRPSAHRHVARDMPAVPLPDECPDFFVPPSSAPTFSHHFEARRALGSSLFSSASEPLLQVWVRHRDTDPGPSPPMARLVALADVVPPPVLALTHEFAPVSTMTWSIDVVLPEEGRASLDGRGWHLLTCRSDAVSDGYSSQEMTVWRPDGTRVLTGRQLVAAFF